MFHLKLKWCSKLYHFEKWNLLCEAKKKGMHTYPFLFEQTTCALRGEKKQALRFKLPFAKNCLAALKIKNKGLLCRPFRSPLFFIFVLCHFDQAKGVKDFLEPSKIRFKRVSFFFTINQLQSIKKHRRSHYVFSF